MQANAFCHLCRLTILHADRKVAGWPQGSLQRSHTRDDAHGGRVLAPITSRRQGHSPGTLCSYQSFDPAAPECPCSRCHCSHSNTHTRELTSTAVGSCEHQRRPPRARLRRCPCQSPGLGCPTIAVSSKPRSSLQTCTFSAFAAPSCGDSASVQTRGQLETGRDGNPPLPPPPARCGH